MAKKFGKFLLFSAIAGAAAYGAYYYLHSKDKDSFKDSEADIDDDFDDFSEDLDEDITPAKERSYVSLNLDKAEAFASEAFHKAKEVISDSVAQVKETVKSVAETGSCSGNFTELKPERNTQTQDVSDTAQDVSDATQDVSDVTQKNMEASPIDNVAPTVEEFFDDANE